MSTWFTLDPSSANNVVFDLMADVNNRIVIYWGDATSQLAFAYLAGGTFSSVSTLSVSEDSTWHLATMTWDTGADEFKVYIDGSQIGVTQTGLGTWAGAFNGEGSIGADAWAVHGFTWNGIIDDARVSTVARSVCRIGAEYNNQAWPDDAVTPTPLPANNPGGGFYAVGAEEVATWTPPSFTVPVTGDGLILRDNGPDDEGRVVVVQNDGKIVVAGWSQQATYDFAVWRYNTDGTPDTSFGGGDGVVFTDVSGATHTAHAAAIQSDGKIVVAGTGNVDFAVVRYLSDGSLDTSFDTDGIATMDPFGGTDLCQGMAIQPDGKIVLSGYVGNVPVTGQDWALVRYNADGSLDLPFGGWGPASPPWTSPVASMNRGRPSTYSPTGRL